jgi:hypothetical protein
MNGLEYGHMAMVAYNRNMLLTNEGQGLDFTLDQPHEVVPVLSGTANFGNEPIVIWRTAFREVLKLKHALEKKADIEAEYRLKMWLIKDNEHWSQQGALDAVEYYESVNGDFDKLKLSYEWNWLDQLYTSLHG